MSLVAGDVLATLAAGDSWRRDYAQRCAGEAGAGAYELAVHLGALGAAVAELQERIARLEEKEPQP